MRGQILPGHRACYGIDAAIRMQPVVVAHQQVLRLVPPAPRQLPGHAMLHAAYVLCTHLVPLAAGCHEAAGVEVHIVIKLQHPGSIGQTQTQTSSLEHPGMVVDHSPGRHFAAFQKACSDPHGPHRIHTMHG